MDYKVCGEILYKLNCGCVYIELQINKFNNYSGK